MTASDSKTILAFGLFTNDVRASVTREQLYQWVTLASLSFSAASLSLTEIQARVSADLNLPHPVPIEHIRRAVASAVTSGHVVEAKGESESHFEITDTRREALHRAEAIHRSNRTALSESLKAKCEEFLGEEFPADLAEIVLEETEYLIEQAFCNFSLEDSRAFSVKDRRDGGASPPAVSLDSLAGRVLTSARLRLTALRVSVTRSQIIQQAVKEAFWSLPHAAMRYIVSLHHRVIYSYILRLDPKLQAFDRHLLRQRMLFLDSNVVLDYLFESSSFHAPVKEVVELGKELGCRVLVSPGTLDELKYHILTRATNHFRLFMQGDEKIKLLVLSGQGAIVVGDYLRTSAKPSNDGFSLYQKAFEALDKVLERYGIAVEGPDAQTIDSDPRFPYVLSKFNDVHDLKVARAVESGRDYQGHNILTEHDARLFLLIHMLRKENPADAMGSKVWLLTRDFTIMLKAQNWMRHEFPRPAAQSVNDWGSLIIGFKSPDVTSMQYEEYVKVLLGSKLGLATEDEEVDVDFLSLLAKNDLLTPQVSQGSPEQVDAHVRALQESQEMQSLLAQLATTRGEKQRADLKSEAVEVLQKVLRSAEERESRARQESKELVKAEDELQAAAVRELALSAQIQALLERMTTLDSQLARFLEINQTLQTKIDQYENTWFMKLWRLLKARPRN